ncbi:MAG: alginate export family protein [Candidatus Omnitrophica bacterium]|nr:alginate export family protein [Candidatus Omnitrophota bacterium]
MLVFGRRFFFLILGFSIWAGVAHADASDRQVEEEKRKVLEKSEFRVLEGEGRFLFDYGAWIDFRYTNYKDDDNDSETPDSLRETFEADNRFWWKLNIKPPLDASYDNEHVVYLRLKDLYIKEFPEDESGDYDHDGPHLDYGYAILDLRPYKIEAGRRYFNVGRGIAYSNVGDGFQINYMRPGWNVGLLAAHTLPHEDNIDISVPGFSKDSDRYYYALGAGYAGIPHHQLYGYCLVQRDFSHEEPNDLNQDFTYDSEYIGIGSKGNITPHLGYWVEVIKQSGTSHVFGTNEESDIDALGANAGAEYQWDMTSRPRLSFEYAYGSGDSERVSVTDTEGGNLSGDDHNFLYFGYFPAGYALAPRLSNIHIYRVGANCYPFEGIRALKNLNLGADYFWYSKDRSQGGISDPEATADSHNIGSEMNLTVSWQILSDLKWAMSYGYFMAGDAYADTANDANQYFSNSLILTF